MFETCSIYKKKLEELNNKIELEMRLGPCKYGIIVQQKEIQLVRANIENMKLLIEKHCN